MIDKITRLYFFIFLITSVFLTSSCSNKNTTKGQFKFSVQSLALATPTSGGIFFLRKDLATQAITIKELSSEEIVEIPNGNYQFLFVVFEGPNKLQGNSLCADIPSIQISGSDMTVEVNLASTTCQEPALINFLNKLLNTNGTWNSTRWDQGKLGT